jgi:glyoxylase-like metal-dependent hydrolase (beta-lactamase superfamily II)
MNHWEAYAIRYGRHDRPKQSNYLMPVDDPHEAMPLDYFIWLLRGPGGRQILVDCGFTEEIAARRGRTIHRSVAQALRDFGTDPAQISDVIITHLHYDHAGNLDAFPKAMFHLQEREMAFATGKHMCVHCIRHPFEVEDVVKMVRHLYNDRLVFHDGEGEVAPGVTVHGIGGHSDGLQMARVATARGPLVIASDAMHFYGNVERDNPYPIIFNLGAMTQGWRTAKKLAGGDETLVVPGHDPLVRERYPAVEGTNGEVVALHLAPRS